MIIKPEQYAQIAVCHFARVHKIPFIHYANERKCSHVYGQLLKKMGVVAGVVDCHLPKSNDTYKDLWIELKILPNKLTKLQQTFMEERSNEGSYVCCCAGKTPKETADKAIEFISWFYGI